MISRIVDSVISSSAMLDHPFYKAWSQGILSMDVMRQYALQWMHVEELFTRFLSKAHAQCEVADVRQIIVDNLAEEEGGRDSASHLSLWMDYAKGIGCSDSHIAESKPTINTANLISIYNDLCSCHEWKAAVCAMYAYESQIPAVAATKVASLVEKYGITSVEVLKFWTLHAEVDKWHAESWVGVMDKYFSEHDKQMAIDCSGAATKALLGFLDGMMIMVQANSHC